MSARRFKGHQREFKGYVALERVGGPIIWGTLRLDAAEARKQFLHWNPGMVPVIVPIRLSFERGG